MDLHLPRKKKQEINNERDERRQVCESSLEEFIKFVHPKRLLGNIHREVIRWLTRSDAKSHQLVLLPRDHMKSTLLAYWVTWRLTKDPTLRILYISSTSNLATKQLKFIKDILTCDNYRILWPEMVEKEEAKREKWTEREISVDHPKRKAESIRDPSIFTAGLTSNIVGLHCDISVLDDVVVVSNAYIEANRSKVESQYSLLSSVEAGEAEQKVAGTRYHPKDMYAKLISMEVEMPDELGRTKSAEPLFEVMEYQVESIGDGSGQFLWPRQQRSDGRWFGFNEEILAVKRAQYVNKLHFRAQYYNDPHDIDASPIPRDLFQYYDSNYLYRREGSWFFNKERLNVVASVDFAYSTGKKSDYTAIVVVGCDGYHNYYVLEIDRFKTTKISDYYQRILKLYEKWGFRKLRAEVSVAQKVIVDDLRDNYIRKEGLSIVIDEFRPTKWIGAKEERIMAILEPRYANRQMWHYQGGNCQVLEEELLFANPSHDDCKDALASAVDFAVPPTNYYRMKSNMQTAFNFNPRFGGVA